MAASRSGAGRGDPSAAMYLEETIESDPGMPTEVTSVIQRLTSSVTGRGGSKRAAPEQATSTHHRRPQKERRPNWTQLEISALIQAKRIKFLEELDNQHEPSLMRRESTQWAQISAKVMEILSNQHVECIRDASACKEKWGTLVVDYKKIYDHHKGTGTGSYWNMTAHERGQLHLPRNFFKNHYDDIDEWFQIRPIMNPPHSRDLSQPGDAVYNRAAAVAGLRPHEVNHSNLPESESTEGERHPERHARSSGPGGLASAPIIAGSAFTPVGLGGVGLGSVPVKPANAAAAQRFSNTPGQPESNPVNPTIPATPGLVNLSSSEASFVDLSRKFGNTGQRRKSLSGHKQIAQATQSTGKSLVNTLEKLNERDSKLQWEIFQEQLNYNRQRDLIQQENVRMTHINQSSLVQAITGLTQVLGASLSRPPTYPPRPIPTTPEPTMYDSHPIHPLYQSYGPANHASYAYGMPSDANQPTFGRENLSPQPTTSGVQYTTNFAAADTTGDEGDVDLAATCSNFE